MAWAILFPCIFIAECRVDQPIVPVAVLRNWRSYWLPPSWGGGLVVLPVGDRARGIVPHRIAAWMSWAPDQRYSGQGAVVVSAIHCDSRLTSKYNINSSQYRSTSRFVLWRTRCNARTLIPHMLPVTAHCNTGYAFNTLRTGLLNCLNARSRGLNVRHRASCI